jgi:hypothetical protein
MILFVSITIGVVTYVLSARQKCKERKTKLTNTVLLSVLSQVLNNLQYTKSEFIADETIRASSMASGWNRITDDLLDWLPNAFVLFKQYISAG